jgi:DNA-directed RNA polymerase subunit beta
MAQTLSFNGRRRVRKFFGKIPEVAEMPNLIEVQKASYDQFLMVDEPEGGRLDEGLQAVFKSVFPISDFSGAAMLEFVKYEFEAPKFDVDECRQRDLTYAAPLKVTLRLIVFRCGRRYRRQVHQGHQGAGRLHGRYAAHD